MDVGVARADHHPVVAVEQQIAVETVGPGLHREEAAEQHRAVGDRCRRHQSARGVELYVAVHPIDRAGEERTQEKREQYPIFNDDIGWQRKEIESDVLVVERVVRAIGYVIEEPQEDAQLWTSPQATSKLRRPAPPAMTRGHGSRWRMNSRRSGGVAPPVGIHSKSAGRCVHAGRAKRDAGDPFSHRMMAVATKTAKKTPAWAPMVVQKTYR